MRLALAGLVGALLGLLQLFAIYAIEYEASGPSGIISSDIAFPFFALLVFLEIAGVITVSMYRMAPWILRALRADWEEQKVLEGRARNHAWLTRGIITAALLRRVVVLIDYRIWSVDLLLSLIVALLALLVPLPKVRTQSVDGANAPHRS